MAVTPSKTSVKWNSREFLQKVEKQLKDKHPHAEKLQLLPIPLYLSGAQAHYRLNCYQPQEDNPYQPRRKMICSHFITYDILTETVLEASPSLGV